MSLPASITGAHAKKQGEDLSDNDGDEDEGIFHGEQRWCMTLALKMLPFSDHLWIFVFLFLIANTIIKHPCHITIGRVNSVVNKSACE